MPYHLELGSDGHSFHGKAIVVNSQTGEHKSHHPIAMDDAKAQMRILEGVASHEVDPPKRVISMKKPKAKETPKAEEPKAKEPTGHKLFYNEAIRLTNLPKKADGSYEFPRTVVAKIITHLETLNHHKEATALKELEKNMKLPRGSPSERSVKTAYKPIIALLQTMALG